ncbi:hypothetical protein F4779DRAFT_209047 [Xylariaceae sp. FL0662B]|nr:hypothetical protein F4779DRAFT_209047 [Xylariaceae sp. FL0662B]
MIPAEQPGHSPRALGRRATRPNPTPNPFFIRRVKKHQNYLEEQYDMRNHFYTGRKARKHQMYREDRYDMRFAYPGNNGNGHGRAAQQNTIPSSLEPSPTQNAVSHAHNPSTRPASRAEIHGLAFGIVFLVLLLGWLLWTGTRLTARFLEKGTADVEERRRAADADVERGERTEAKAQPHTYRHLKPQPEETRALASNLHLPLPSTTLRHASADGLAELARKRGVDMATGFRRDLGEFRRIARPADEEAGLGLGLGFAPQGVVARSAFLPAP